MNTDWNHDLVKLPKVISLVNEKIKQDFKQGLRVSSLNI